MASKMTREDLKNLAEEYFVVHGFSIETILKNLPKKIARKTIYNWRKKYKWDDKRKVVLKENETIEDDVHELLKLSFNKARNDPSYFNFIAYCKMLGAYASFKKNNKAIIDDDNVTEKIAEKIGNKQLSEATAKQLLELLGLGEQTE